MEASARDIEDAKRAQWEARESSSCYSSAGDDTGRTSRACGGHRMGRDAFRAGREEQRGHLDGVLRRALQEKSAPPGRPEYAQMEVDTAPPGLTDGHSMGLQTEGPGHYVERSPRTPVRFDPYQASSPVTTLPHTAEAAAPGRRTSPVHPGQRDPNATRIPTSEGAPRPSIKIGNECTVQCCQGSPRGNQPRRQVAPQTNGHGALRGQWTPSCTTGGCTSSTDRSRDRSCRSQGPFDGSSRRPPDPGGRTCCCPTPLPATFLEDDDLDLT